MLTEHRDTEAVLRFLKKAIRRHGVPETITIDGSDANEAAIKSYNEGIVNLTRKTCTLVQKKENYIWFSSFTIASIFATCTPSAFLTRKASVSDFSLS